MKRRPASAGKRVGGAFYLHVSALAEADPGIRARVERAASLIGSDEWNVAKVQPNSVSLLLYEGFDEAAFPALLRSARVDLRNGAVIRTDYSRRANPPILHRKEQFLPLLDPRRPAYAALTRIAEER